MYKHALTQDQPFRACRLPLLAHPDSPERRSDTPIPTRISQRLRRAGLVRWASDVND